MRVIGDQLRHVLDQHQSLLLRTGGQEPTKERGLARPGPPDDHERRPAVDHAREQGRALLAHHLQGAQSRDPRR